ncbi:hypothetical protein [Chondromyces apiculatus]|uniref:Uncharacterized protein n=1 Tax=Chondromyces apiculatus DSM 436 TaxID=1192034 RepID=A0A017SVZ8_9BACT|nr:hypothetical protein [Chondromyces apiculatus]EYF00476.1 Hypothetical protein CAP_0566 [Chondromyces apiculatus DSM 436]
MTLRVRVKWPNAGTPLLPEAHADVQLEAGGAPLPIAHRGPGVREFEVPEGTAKVTLKARFVAALGGVTLADGTAVPPQKHEVLRVEQPYDVVEGETTLAPVNLPAYIKGHPLVDTSAVANVRGAVLLQLRTEFVDITPFWKAYALHHGEYARDRTDRVTLVVVGSTGASPLIWFACVPDACHAPLRPGISALVFFRPSNYAYSRVDEPHDAFGLNRYLLAPVATDEIDPAAPPPYWARDQFTADPQGSLWAWLRCGFERALASSGKPAVLLIPWPSALDFGRATSAELPVLAEGVIRLLWATQRLAKQRGAIHLGRLALSGYSAGGLGLWAAFANNLERTGEVYAFDARGTQANAGMAVKWFNDKPSRKLRLTGGFQLTANEGIRRAIEKLGGSLAGRFSRLPADEKAYAPGATAYWDHACALIDAAYRPGIMAEPAYWHQYAVFGGDMIDPAFPVATFLELFLRASDL